MGKTMANHTPEPWKTDEREILIFGNDGNLTAIPFMCAGRPSETPKANARRIVACVNACAGIPNDALNDLDGTLNKIKSAIEINRTIALADDAKLATVTAQRDELLAAVKSAKSWLEGWASADQEIEILDMAIAKCEVQNDA